MKIKVKRLSESAIIPTRKNGDAGYDLYATEDCILNPLERKLFKTDISLEIPLGYYGKICDKSGQAYKQGLHVLAGTIDSSYRGNIGVVLINLKHEWVPYGTGVIVWDDKNQQRLFEGLKPQTVTIKKGEQIAQIIILKHEDAEFEEGELSETERGALGFGQRSKT